MTFHMPGGWYEPAPECECEDECTCAEDAEEEREAALLARDDD